MSLEYETDDPTPKPITALCVATWQYKTFGNWFKTPFTLLKLLGSTDEAMYLSILLNITNCRMEKILSKGVDYSGWFPCSFERMAGRIPNLTRRIETRIVNRLKKRKYLYSKRSKRYSGKRMFWIDGNQIGKDIQELQTKS